MQFLKYTCVAGIAYCIDFGGYIFLLSFEYSPIVANALTKVVAAFFGFFAHRYFTYSIIGINNIRSQAVRYFGLALFYTPLSSMLLNGIMYLISNPIYAKALSDISLFMMMYWITSKLSFSQKDQFSTKV